MKQLAASLNATFGVTSFKVAPGLLSSEQRHLDEFKALDPLSMTREMARLRSDPKASGPLIRACAAAFRDIEQAE